MNSYHEVAMLSAQLWGEANAQVAEPEQFGADVAAAYNSAFSCMECEQEFAEAVAYGIVPADAAELLRNIATKQAK